MKLLGKKALITGGNSGIGLATARLFIAEGAQVAITGRDSKTLDAAIEQLGSNAIAFKADVSDRAARKDLFSKLQEQFGELHVVFANAGISGATPAGKADEDVFENILRVNITGAYFTVDAALPLLKDGSSIVFNGSVLGSLGMPGIAAYAASKAGIFGLARTLAGELAPRNIRVNVVAPGPTKTPIWGRNSSVAPEQAAESAKRIAATIPLGRWAEADEVAKAVLYLASDDSSYVNGVELFVDGGSTGSPLGVPAYRR